MLYISIPTPEDQVTHSNPVSQFPSLPIRIELQTSLASLEYSEMTPVQSGSLPLILEGRDVLAQARTGSGKTAAFAIGLLNKLDIQHYKTQALVLCPTRELADQVTTVIRRLANALANTKVLTLCGGTPMQSQLASLQRDAHVVVGTPGRILKHIEKGSLELKHLETLVLDEADRMLDMGFHDDIMRVLSRTPTQKQTLLFSATYPEEIQKISNTIQQNPFELRVEKTHHHTNIRQVFYEVSEPEKNHALITILQHYQPQSALVFCNQKQQCQQLTDTLRQQGFYALALHGDLDQHQRDQAITQFSNDSCSLLVATDVAARGLDIKDLAAVINYDLTTDPEMHVHRIGRTGRAGSDGLAISLVLPTEDFRVEAIEQYQNSPAIRESFNALNRGSGTPRLPPMVTLQINAGKKDKIRPGDILGALTASTEVSGGQIGKIIIRDKSAYVAVERQAATAAQDILTDGKIKGRKCKVKKL